MAPHAMSAPVYPPIRQKTPKAPAKPGGFKRGKK